MGIFVALLRGINVSGKNIIKMAELRDSLSKTGFVQLKTYLQSGNLVFISESTDQQQIAKIISSRILQDFGHDVNVKVLSKEQFENSFAQNPFVKDSEVEIKQLYYIHSFGEINSEVIAEIQDDPKITEQLFYEDQVIYVNYNAGYGKSKITHSFFERKLKIPVTARNHNTMRNLVKLASEIQE